MPRPRGDGLPTRPAYRRALTELFVRRVKASDAGAPSAWDERDAGALNVWDERERGLVLRVQPTGHRAFKFVYSRRGRACWYHIGSVPLLDARRIAAKLRVEVAEGGDPVARRRAERGADTFAELARRYVEEWAKRRNKSWAHSAWLVKKYLLPRWARLDARSISRRDVRDAVGKIAAPMLANQVLAAASAIFSWGVRHEVVALNPCVGVERNATRSRERILSDSELPRFWSALGEAGLRGAILKTILLTGQRPGEVAHMRLEHVGADGWWEMPGRPDPKLGWPGTKNSATHRVWLPQAVQDIINGSFSRGASAGFVFSTSRGNPVPHLDAAMREICQQLGVENRVTPHDLRRTHGTMITRRGFGRDAMNRVQNHKEGGIADVYDRHEYEEENQRVMEAVARHIVDIAEGRSAGVNVIQIKRS